MAEKRNAKPSQGQPDIVVQMTDRTLISWSAVPHSCGRTYLGYWYCYQKKLFIISYLHIFVMCSHYSTVLPLQQTDWCKWMKRMYRKYHTYTHCRLTSTARCTTRLIFMFSHTFRLDFSTTTHTCRLTLLVWHTCTLTFTAWYTCRPISIWGTEEQTISNNLVTWGTLILHDRAEIAPIPWYNHQAAIWYCSGQRGTWGGWNMAWWHIISSITLYTGSGTLNAISFD